MRAWSALRQFLAAAFCAGLALPASATVPLSSSTPSHAYYPKVLSITRARSSSEKILLHFEVVRQLSGKKHWSYGERSWKNMAGLVVTYDYDAFGNLIHSTGTTPNNYLFAGEQFDPDLNLYYNRARYLNTSTGRFWTPDSFEGTSGDPGSQHRYLYSFGNPVDYADPSGKSGNSIFNIWGNLVQKKVFADYQAWILKNGHVGFTNRSIKTILGLPSGPRGDEIYDKPDIADVTDMMIYEIKPKIDAAGAYADIGHYMALILTYGGGAWLPGTNFSAPQQIPLLGGLYIATVEPTINGAILYSVASKSPTGIPILPIPLSPDTISEEAIAEEEKVVAQAAEAEVEEVEVTAPVLQF